MRLGFAEATGDVLMILDADLTVPPEDLPRFYEVIRSGKGEFVNGVRLVYPMEKQAMRFANLLGNKFFSLAFSWLLGQPIKDTLCGTKVLRRADYEAIAANRAYFGDFDPFGDFDLLFGAAKLSLEIVDLPVRYRERTYGDTNIQRWRHGWLLLQDVRLRRGADQVRLMAGPETLAGAPADPRRSTSTTRAPPDLRRRVLADKPFLRRIYEEWYAALAASLPAGPGAVLELGSGAGFLADAIPGLVRSEIFHCPEGIDAVVDGPPSPSPPARCAASS